MPDWENGAKHQINTWCQSQVANEIIRDVAMNLRVRCNGGKSLYHNGPPSITVVIPNYNGAHLLKETVSSVHNALKVADIKDFEIVISDDCSNDGSANCISKHFNDILFLEHKERVGYSGNVNRGIGRASKDYVLIINTDVRLASDFFDTMFHAFEWPDTFGVSPGIYNNEGRLIDGAKFPDMSFCRIKGTTNYKTTTSDSLYTLVLSGACCLVDRKKLIDIGSFLDIFNPYYFEDVDLGIRAWRKGCKLYYNPYAKCIHRVSSTIRNENKFFKDTAIMRNLMFLHYLHLPWKWYYLWSPIKKLGRCTSFQQGVIMASAQISFNKKMKELQLLRSIIDGYPYSIVDVKKRNYEIDRQLYHM